MLMIIRTLLLSIALAIVLPIVEAQAETHGALAVERGRGDGFGISHSYRTRDAARTRALRECGGRRCEIVLEFDRCAAYADDQSRVSDIAGRGEHRSSRQAQEKALRECSERGGRRCTVRISACNN